MLLRWSRGLHWAFPSVPHPHEVGIWGARHWEWVNVGNSHSGPFPIFLTLAEVSRSQRGIKILSQLLPVLNIWDIYKKESKTFFWICSIKPSCHGKRKSRTKMWMSCNYLISNGSVEIYQEEYQPFKMWIVDTCVCQSSAIPTSPLCCLQSSETTELLLSMCHLGVTVGTSCGCMH